MTILKHPKHFLLISIFFTFVWFLNGSAAGEVVANNNEEQRELRAIADTFVHLSSAFRTQISALDALSASEAADKAAGIRGTWASLIPMAKEKAYAFYSSNRSHTLQTSAEWMDLDKEHQKLKADIKAAIERHPDILGRFRATAADY